MKEFSNNLRCWAKVVHIVDNKLKLGERKREILRVNSLINQR